MSPDTDWLKTGFVVFGIAVGAILLFVWFLVSRGFVKRQSFNTLGALLIGLGTLTWVVINKDRFPQPQPETTRSRPADRFPPSVAQMVITRRLRDPDSANFGKISVYDDRKLKGKQVSVACGSVNAKNGFGGFTGFTNFLVIDDGYQVFMDSSGDNSAFVALWNSLCAGKHS